MYMKLIIFLQKTCGMSQVMNQQISSLLNFQFHSASPVQKFPTGWCWLGWRLDWVGGSEFLPTFLAYTVVTESRNYGKKGSSHHGDRRDQGKKFTIARPSLAPSLIQCFFKDSKMVSLLTSIGWHVSFTPKGTVVLSTFESVEGIKSLIAKDGGITYKKLVLFECVIGTPRLVALASTFLLYKSRPVSTKAGPRTRERKEYWFTQARSSWQNLYRCKPTDNASENTYSICSLFLADKKMAWCISSIFSFQPADTLPKSLNHSPKSHQKSLIRADPFFPKNWRQITPNQTEIHPTAWSDGKTADLEFHHWGAGFFFIFFGAPGTLENLNLPGAGLGVY